MDVLDAYRLWADGHVFYHSPLASRITANHPLMAREAEWQRRIIHQTPNGELFQRNVLFDALTSSSTVTLLHTTHGLERISQRGIIYPSGGCLVGSVYCCPLIPADDGYRIHNLGKYVLTREAPAFVARLGKAGGTPTPLIIEITMPPDAYRGLAGIDYLRLGSIHLQIFRQLEYLLSRTERHGLREKIVGRIKNSAAFLDLCAAVCHAGEKVAPGAFLPLLSAATVRLPILGYLCFEALSEYLMLHSTSPETRRLKEIGELNNRLYKDMLFAAFPGMAGAFNLSEFRPTPEDLRLLLKKVDPTIDAQHAQGYLVERISFLVNARLLAPDGMRQEWHHTRWEFDSLCERVGPLVGHLIHRELRSFGRYPDFYFYYDQHKALQVWNYWNHMDIVVPFNGTIPKGEVGINPAYPDLDYSIYLGKLTPDGTVHPVKKLNLRITPRLVDLKYTLMRDSRGGAIPLDDD